MKVRGKDKKWEGVSKSFNISSISEILIYGDWGGDSTFINECEVYLESKKIWKDMSQAFKDKDIITDNYNTRFFEPPTKEDRERGFTL